MDTMSVLKGLLTAREGSYFKTEQEDELQVYRRRRIKEGAIKDDPRLPGEGPRGFVSSEKLAEIHAQEARLSAPPGVSRQQMSSLLPNTSTKGGYRTQRGMDTGLYKVPSLRQNRWSGLNLKDLGDLKDLPEETLASSRHKAMMDKSLAVGTRALLYGTLIAAGGIAGITALTASYCDVHSADDLRLFMNRRLGPSVDRMKASLVPWKAYFKTLDVHKYVSKDSIK